MRSPTKQSNADRQIRASSNEDDPTSMMSTGATPPSTNLWVGNLSLDTTESELWALFSKYGPLDRVTTCPSRNYAFVYFKHVGDAKSAKDSLRGTLVRGTQIRIQFAKSESEEVEEETEVKEWGEISDDVEEEEMEEEEEEEEMEEEEEEEGKEVEGEEEEDFEDLGEEEGEDVAFENELDRLDYVDGEDDDVGNDTSSFVVEEDYHQQFDDGLDYEALAEKKRKTLLSQPRLLKKARNDPYGVKFEELLEEMTGHRRRRKSRMLKKRGRRRGYKKKLNPEISKKLGDANLHYACGNYEEAIKLLKEVVRMAPNLPDAHHTLGLIYNATGDRKKAMNFYMIAAHLSPKDPSLWKLLVAWSIEQGNTGQVRYCLSKAITADPEDISLRMDRALLFVELGDYLKAAEAYNQIILLFPSNVEACKMAAKMYGRCGRVEKAIHILENYLSKLSSEIDLGVVNLLMYLYMENNLHMKALDVFERINSLYFIEKDVPLYLKVKAGVCHAYIGNMEKCEDVFENLLKECLEDNSDLIIEAADAFFNLGLYEYALKYYCSLEGTSCDKAPLQLRVSDCYLRLKEISKAIHLHYKALSRMKDNIHARIMLSSILVQEERYDEAITLLSPPEDTESLDNATLSKAKPWWLDGRIKMQLARIYHNKGMVEEFVDTILSPIHETLLIKVNKATTKKRLTVHDLSKRAKLLDDQTGSVFCGFKPIATPSELLKASRAKKALKKWAEIKEKRNANALATGHDWKNEELEDGSPLEEPKQTPFPKLLKDDEHYCIVLDLCKALVTLRRHWEALEIINLSLQSGSKTMPRDKKEELRTLRAQIAYNATDPKHGYEFVRSIVLRHPNSCAAWNCYYKVISRLDYRLPKHAKFLQKCGKDMQSCVPPMIIHGHQFTMNSQHQDAARKYIQAYKLQPDSPLINLCAGTALINLALGFRLKNKHLTLIQGLGFLYEYLHICNKSQEAMYNVARALQHVGLFTLAASYYEKVLEMEEKDYPIPRILNEVTSSPETMEPGYCNLRREAAYNLHLIYKKSGAVDLARQILKTYCTI